MKHLFTVLIMVILITALTAIGQVPQTISYQGLLTDNNGTNVPSGDYSILFNLYNVSTAGSPLWAETQTVTITDGIFNVKLGAVNPLILPFDEGYWLGITIDGGSELLPRVELTSSAYSHKSRSVEDSSVTSASIANGQTVRSINSLKDDVIVAAGNNISVLQNGDSLIISATGVGNGDITAVTAGNGLSGGGVSGDVSLDIGTGQGILAGTDDIELDTIYTDNRYAREGDVVKTINTLSDNIRIVEGNNISISTAGDSLQISAVGVGIGDITAVNAGNGISGGGTGGDVTLNIEAGNGVSVTADTVALNTTYTDNRYVNENQTNSVVSTMIQDGQVANTDIANNAVTANKISPNILSSVDGVNNDGGNVDFIEGSNISIVSDDANNTITFSSSGGSSGGDITAVTAGTGLTGGGTTGDVTLNHEDLSSQNSVNNSNGTVIQDVAMGTLGHVTGITSYDLDNRYYTEAEADGFFVNENQTNSINGAMISDGSIESIDINNNSITDLDLANNSVTAAKISPDVVSSVDGVSNDAGNVDFVAGNNITITPDDGTNQITFSASASNLWSQTSSDIYYNSGNVGIGTATPLYPLTLFPGTNNRGLSINHNQTGAGHTYGIYNIVNKTSTDNSNVFGVYSLVTNNNGTNNTYGISASATGTSAGPKYAVRGYAYGSGPHYGVYGHASGTGTQYGVFGHATGTGTLWSGYFTGNVYTGGNLGIGTSTPTTRLEVADTIYSSVGGFKFPDGTVQTTAATSGGGNITAVNAGDGLTGGGTTGDVTLNVAAGTGISVDANSISLDEVYSDNLYVEEGETNSIATAMITNNAVTASKVSPNIVSSVDGVSNDAGNIDLVAGSNVTITPNNTSNTITISATAQTGNTLDQAYDQGGAGAGRTITANNGAVNITGSDGLTVNGNVGIGTTSATYPLTIHPGTNARGLMIDHNQTSVISDSRGIVVDVDKTSSGDTQLYGGTFWVTNNLGSGTTRGIFSSVDGSSNGIKIGLQGTATGGGNHYGVLGSATGSGTQYGIHGSASGTGTLWAGYFSSGNVHISNRLGIGTLAPGAGLHLSGDGYPNSFMFLESTSGGDAGFRLYEGTTDKWHIFNNANLDGLQIYNNAGQNVFFADQSNANVGIGTATLFSNTKLLVEADDEIAILGSAEPTGAGNYVGTKGWVSGGAGTNYGVNGIASNGNYNFGVYGGASGGSIFNVGVYGDGYSSTANYAGYFYGNVECTGGYTKSFSKNKIDHPLDPENKYLYHSGVESSDMMNVYNGNEILDSNGEAWVDLPDWFEALNKEFRYQLTCIGGFAQVYIAEEVQNNRFKIGGGKSGMKISWQITGIRKDKLADQFRVVVEEDKPTEERGKYLHPQAFGLDESRGIGYEESKRMNAEHKNIINQPEEDL